ncbi:MAG TPA: DUF2877 domain-containing protein [Casimicrobiaceae bacterium]|nr:DUF2877 domain-containing protein [Casimicrobiaceae bacterium]
MSCDTNVVIVTVGSRAAEALRAHERGHVFAVFERSFYVRFGDDLVCFGPLALRAGPLNALYEGRMSWPERGLAPDVGVVRDGTSLRIDERVRVDFADAQPWTPPVGPRAIDCAILRAGLDRLAACVARRAPGGFGSLLCARRAKNDPLLDASAPAIVSLRAWLSASLANRDEPPPDVDALIGLGGGLTPSGDDYLCGLMTALNYFGHGSIASRLAGVVLPIARHETNLVSQAYLRCASAGEASIVLFDVLECLLDAEQPALDERLDAVDAVGHTSGWDCLAGAVAVCATLVD